MSDAHCPECGHYCADAIGQPCVNCFWRLKNEERDRVIGEERARAAKEEAVGEQWERGEHDGKTLWTRFPRDGNRVRFVMTPQPDGSKVWRAECASWRVGTLKTRDVPTPQDAMRDLVTGARKALAEIEAAAKTRIEEVGVGPVDVGEFEEDGVDDAVKKIEELTAENEALRREVQGSRADVELGRGLAKKVDRLQVELDELTAENERLVASLEMMNETCDRVAEERDSLKGALGVANDAYDTAEEINERLRSELREANGLGADWHKEYVATRDERNKLRVKLDKALESCARLRDPENGGIPAQRMRIANEAAEALKGEIEKARNERDAYKAQRDELAAQIDAMPSREAILAQKLEYEKGTGKYWYKASNEAARVILDMEAERKELREKVRGLEADLSHAEEVAEGLRGDVRQAEDAYNALREEVAEVTNYQNDRDYLRMRINAEASITKQVRAQRDEALAKLRAVISELGMVSDVINEWGVGRYRQAIGVLKEELRIARSARDEALAKLSAMENRTTAVYDGCSGLTEENEELREEVRRLTEVSLGLAAIVAGKG